MWILDFPSKCEWGFSLVCSIAANAFIVSSKRTWNVFSGLWYGHWGNVKWGVMSVKVLVAFEWAVGETTARPFSRRKCPYQTSEARHTHLSLTNAQAFSHPKLAREVWVMDEFYCEGVRVETKPLKFWQNIQGEVFLGPRYKKKRMGGGKGKNSKPFLTAAAVLAMGVLFRDIGHQSSGSECSPWWWCYQELWQPLANTEVF